MSFYSHFVINSSFGSGPVRIDCLLVIYQVIVDAIFKEGVLSVEPIKPVCIGFVFAKQSLGQSIKIKVLNV